MKTNSFSGSGSARLIAHIDLDAIAQNWQVLNKISGNAGAVIKADGYGHGMIPVATALAHAGCQQFFTASFDEALALRGALPNHQISYFDGIDTADIDEMLAHQITPSINTLKQLHLLADAARKAQRPIPAMLQLDTGMNRIGASHGDAQAILNSPDLKAGQWQLVYSHLVSADEADNPLNEIQRQRFDELQQSAPPAPRSLAATGGIMLGQAFHYDLSRPGLGLYGLSPLPEFADQLIPALSLSAKVLQVRNAKVGETVGYGATYQLTRDSRLAAIAGGYADGISRKLSDLGYVAKDGLTAPMVGRVSMDVHVVDITDWPEDALAEGDRVFLINSAAKNAMTASIIAEKIDTIPYEVLTTLGLRAKPLYAGAILEQLDL